MHKHLALASLLTAAFLCSPALAHGPHQHGAARMDFAVEGARVTIDLESPLANALGFEHAPANDAQRKEVRDMAAGLRRAEKIFLLPEAAQCRPARVVLRSESLDPALLGEPRAAKPTDAHGAKHAGGHEEKGHVGHEAHGDLNASFVFDCARPEALNSLDVQLFKIWPALRVMGAQMVTPKGQRAGELTPVRHTLKW